MKQAKSQRRQSPEAPKSLASILIMGAAAGWLAACGEPPQQYQYEIPSTASADGSSHSRPRAAYSLGLKAAFLSDKPTRPNGGLLFLERPEETEAGKDEKTRQNSLIPINYQKGAAGNISMETNYEESLGILNFDRATSSGVSVYKEGLAAAWRDDTPRVPYVIYILGSYQGSLDFGPFMGENRFARIGQSFASHFSEGEMDILEDPKARAFITSLYRHLEGGGEDCLAAQTCSLSINPQSNYVLFQLPKMYLLFGNNERRKLAQIALIRNNDPACFLSPFDLVTGKFHCEGGDGSKTVFGLGGSYRETLEKSGIDRGLPITYSSNFLRQETQAVSILWKRNNFEEKEPAIPDDSHLSAVVMRDHEYNMPFLINESLVKVSLADGGGQSLALSLEPLAENGGPWSMEGIKKKMEAVKGDPSVFYLATEMPQIRDNYPLQKNLISALLDLLESARISPSPHLDSAIQTGKRVFGRHSDTFALKAEGLLKTQSIKGRRPMYFYIEIDEGSGRALFILSLADDNDFEGYAMENQSADLDLSQPAEGLLGFKLGSRIYLRDKKPGPGTAIAAYPADGGRTLIALSSYSDEVESSAVYPSGRDKNIAFEKSERITAGGVSFYIHPTFQAKDIGGKSFDEYEISKISANSGAFFGAIRALCGIEGFDVSMGLRDQEFADRLEGEIQQARAGADSGRPFEGCFYMAPLDSLFSGVKRTFYFPKHKLILDFTSRELAGLTIYKKPLENKEAQK